jgi:hypothetical protein
MDADAAPDRPSNRRPDPDLHSHAADPNSISDAGSQGYPTGYPTYYPTPTPTGTPIPNGLTVKLYDQKTRQLIQESLPVSTTVGYGYTSNGSVSFDVPEPMAVSIEAPESLRYYGASTVAYVSKPTTTSLYLTPKPKGSLLVTLRDAESDHIITNKTIPVTVSDQGTKQVSSGTGYWPNLDFDLYEITTANTSDYYESASFVFVQGNETVTMKLYPKNEWDPNQTFVLDVSAYDRETGLDIADRTVYYTFASGESGSGHPDARFILQGGEYNLTAQAEGITRPVSRSDSDRISSCQSR